MTIYGHFYITNDDGEVIFDPHFPQYDGICAIHDADPSKPRYRHAPKHIQRDAIQKNILPTITDFMKNKEELTTGETGEIFKQYEFAQCALNVCVYKALWNGEGRITYGDFGWELKDGSGVWYEFEWSMENDKSKEQMLEDITTDRCVAKMMEFCKEQQSKMNPNKFLKKMKRIKRIMKSGNFSEFIDKGGYANPHQFLAAEFGVEL